MKLYSYVIPAALVAAASFSPRMASAHFIWATIDNGQARFALLENPAADTDARWAKYVASATPYSGSAKLTLGEPKDGARFAPLAAGQRVVATDITVGAKERDGVEYLLVYHAKGAIDAGAASLSAGAPVEVFAKQNGKQLVVEVQREKKPVADSEVSVYFPGGDPEEPLTLKTGATGKITANLPAEIQAGKIGVRALVVEKRAGENEGKKYDEVHHYATLTYNVDGIRADPVAWNLLKEASENRATWDASVDGMTADINLDWNGKTYTGTVGYISEQGVVLTLPNADKTVTDWAESELSSLLGHRRSGTFAKGDGRHPITFMSYVEKTSALGPQLQMHDAMQSSYRVKDKHIQVVDRTMGPTRLVINMLDFAHTETGKYLPKQFVVTHLDTKTGAIKKSEMFSDTFQPIEGNYVPATRRIITAENGTFVSKSITLSNIKLHRAETAAKR